MNRIGCGRGIGGALRHTLQGENFIRHIGNDKLIFDFKSGSGTTVKDRSREGNDGKFKDIVLVYASQYPPAQSDTYVKATSKYSTAAWAYFATDPAKSLTGGWPDNAWYCLDESVSQRFHIDLGSAKIIKRIYYENFHHLGSNTDRGVQNFTFWGSNTAGSFAELTYGTDTGWTRLTTSPIAFVRHTDSDIADPRYATVTNTTAYRYYAFKFVDSYGAIKMGVRRIELQIDTYPTDTHPTWKRNSLYFDGGDYVDLTGITHGISTGGFTLCFHLSTPFVDKTSFDQKVARVYVFNSSGIGMHFLERYVSDAGISIKPTILQVTRNNSGKLECYVNGKSYNKGQFNSRDITYNGSSIITLGCRSELDYFITGTMYSFRILNKCLSGIECQQEYLANKFSNN